MPLRLLPQVATPSLLSSKGRWPERLASECSLLRDLELGSLGRQPVLFDIYWELPIRSESLSSSLWILLTFPRHIGYGKEETLIPKSSDMTKSELYIRLSAKNLGFLSNLSA